MQAQTVTVWKHSAALYLVVFVIWGIYRYLFRLPVLVEEVGLKGLLFGGGTLVAVSLIGWGWKELGITTKNLTQSVRLGILAGLLLGFLGQIGSIIRDGQLSSQGLTSEGLGTFLMLALMTAFWEQLVFSGYLLTRLQAVVADGIVRSWLVALMFTLIHIPALVIVQAMSLPLVMFSCILLLLLQMACNLLRLKYDNLAAPILAHALWGVTIFLF